MHPSCRSYWRRRQDRTAAENVASIMSLQLVPVHAGQKHDRNMLAELSATARVAAEARTFSCAGFLTRSDSAELRGARKMNPARP